MYEDIILDRKDIERGLRLLKEGRSITIIPKLLPDFENRLGLEGIEYNLVDDVVCFEIIPLIDKTANF